jgi:AcrR family transcriptional regulator
VHDNQPNEPNAPRRRVPQQVRSRDRFERILEATAQLVVSGGVESVSTRAIAGAADVPVASLYQYFADKESVLLALVERDLSELEARVEGDLARLTRLDVRAIVETTIRAFVAVYRRRPALVMIWLRGRTNPEIDGFCREHIRRMARDLFEVARRAGMVVEDSTGLFAELAFQVTDRLFQVAFEHSFEGDAVVIEETIALVTSYLETHATPAGIEGVDAPGPSPEP